MGLPVLLKNPKILLIGAGNVALQKAKVLSENEIDFFTISDTFIEEIYKYTKEYKQKDFEISDIEGYDYIINATGNKNITDQLLQEKTKRFFLLNVVDAPELCDFYFSALLKIGKLQISISTNGASPIVSKLIREKIKKTIPKEIEDILEDSMAKRLEGIINKK